MLEHPWNKLYKSVNPLYQTPALLLPDREVLSENAAILLHLAASNLDKKIGFAQGTREHDRLNQMLS